MRFYSREDRFQYAVDSGLFGISDREKVFALLRENESVSEMYRGQLVSILRDTALDFAGDDRLRLEDAYVVLLPTEQLNARVFKAPSGRGVIVLNHAVILHVQLLVRTVLGFMTWHTEVPYSHDVSQEAFALAIIALARFVALGNWDALRGHQEALMPPNARGPDTQTIKWAELIEIFILLHEYGHLVHGHLEEGVEPSPLEGDLLEVPKRHQQEYVADAYAVQRLVKTNQEHLFPRDVAFIVGLVLRFFVFCERLYEPARPSTTHPTSEERWERVKEITNVAETPGAVASQLDSAFAAIERGMNLGR